MDSYYECIFLNIFNCLKIYFHYFIRMAFAKRFVIAHEMPFGLVSLKNSCNLQNAEILFSEHAIVR